MHRDFPLYRNIALNTLPYPTLVTIIDGRPISSRDVLEESEAVRAVLRSTACLIDFNVIHSPTHPVILGFAPA